MVRAAPKMIVAHMKTQFQIPLRSWMVGLALCSVFLLGLQAGTATKIGDSAGLNGLYFTGVDNSGNLSTGTDAHWSVTYASTNGGSTQNTTYQGAGVVVPTLDGGWHANSASARWITAPTGYSLPGNGNVYDADTSKTTNMGIYVYTLKFWIDGTGTGTVTNQVAISLSISADDQYKIYVNPAGNGTTLPASSTAAASATNAWNNTTSFTLANYTSSTTTNNSVFKIGWNYLVVEVDNTNSITKRSTATDLNPSGLLFYQTGNQFALIDGQAFNVVGGNTVPVPEVGTWLPAVGALGLLGSWLWRRKLQTA